MGPTGTSIEVTPEVAQLSMLDKRINNLCDKCRWLVEDWDYTSSIESIAEAIWNGTAVAVTDGSYKDGWGTAMLAISDQQARSIIWARHLMPGNEPTQLSTRSETGVFMVYLSWLSCLKKLTQSNQERSRLAQTMIGHLNQQHQKLVCQI